MYSGRCYLLIAGCWLLVAMQQHHYQQQQHEHQHNRTLYPTDGTQPNPTQPNKVTDSTGTEYNTRNMDLQMASVIRWNRNAIQYTGGPYQLPSQPIIQMKAQASNVDMTLPGW